MEFIKNTSQELEVCQNYKKDNRENTGYKNYLEKIFIKPWGKEYLAYQQNNIGIWILHVHKNKETSVHCHFKKDTILMSLKGAFKINLFENYRILNELECIYVPRNTFHGIHSYTDGSILMEIELYTDKINYSDKNDLLRLRDSFIRDKDKYETSVKEIKDEKRENMNFMKEGVYNLGNTKVIVKTVNNFLDINKFSKIFLLRGAVFNDGKRITEGSLLKNNSHTSVLSENVDLLIIENIHNECLNKIIYSKKHLEDYLNLNNLKNIGMTCGCFDILHQGHLENLKLSKTYCEHLFLCLSSDEQIKRLKGKNRPINNLKDRIFMLINFEFIDKIILYDEENDEIESELDKIMNITNPDFWFKGSDYKEEKIFLKHPALKKIILHDLVDNKSTTKIIEKIKNNCF